MTGFEQRNNAFARAMTDVEMAYIDAERKVVELEKENDNLRGKLQALRAHGIEVVDAVAGGVEIYNEEHAELDRLKTENEKLRDELKQWERLTEGIELPAYPITQFEPKDLERENKRLRKTCLDLYSHLLKFGYMPNTHKVDFYPTLRDLGILTCSNCAMCEAHGYPPKGVEKMAFTVSLWCSDKGVSTGPYDSCDGHIIGEPRIVRDDVDVF